MPHVGAGHSTKIVYDRTVLGAVPEDPSTNYSHCDRSPGDYAETWASVSLGSLVSWPSREAA